MTIGEEFWKVAKARYDFTSTSTVVDIGCGCGRLAQNLSNSNIVEYFSGRYIGVDIDEEAIEWCRSNFDERFVFHIAKAKSTSYNKYIEHEMYYIPEDDSSADIVFSTSLFSHLLEDNARHYLRESYRLLRVGGFMHHTFFLKENFDSLQGRHTFKYRRGLAFVESEKQLEAAVAYDIDDISQMTKDAGFTSLTVQKIVKDRPQSVLIARKIEA